MLKNILLIALVLASATQVASLAVGNVTLKADTGEFLKICTNCGSTKTDSASVQPVNGDGTQFWQLELVGDKVAFKGSHGFYLTRCNGCWPGGMFPDSVSADAISATGSALWTPELLSSGKYHFISDIGGYLARCYGCNSSPNSTNFAFVNTIDATNPVGQWEVTYSTPPITMKAGNVTLKADTGEFLKICTNCGSAVADSASVQVASDGTQFWQLELVGDKIAFKGSNGHYLSRCRDCWAGGMFPDSVTVHTTDTSDAATLWTPELLPNGKYHFLSDIGGYLARCYGCNSSPVSSNFAFVNTIDANNPVGQWNITYFNTNTIQQFNPIKNGKIELITYEGYYVSICHQCGSTENDSAAAQSNMDGTQVWEMELHGDKVAFKGSNGLYLTRCQDCWPGSNITDSVMVSALTPTGSALWIPFLIKSNGKFAFKGDNGKYLGICNSCNESPASSRFAYVNIESIGSAVPILAQMFVKSKDTDNADELKAAIISLSNYISPNKGSYQAGIYQIQLYDNGKVTLRDRITAKFLSLCFGCSPKYPFTDMAFSTESNIVSRSFWEMTTNADGTYVLKGENGKYMTICSICKLSKTEAPILFVNSTVTTPGSMMQVTYQFPPYTLPFTGYLKNNLAMPSAGLIRIRADNGQLLQNCFKQDHACFTLADGPDHWWNMAIDGWKVTLSIGNEYLAEIDGKLTGRVKSSKDPRAKWTPVLNVNGKWSFQGLSRNFLNRCFKCKEYKSNTYNDATVFGKLPSESTAQFSLIYF